MTSKLILDKAGRVVLPKKLREELHLGAGDAIQMESEGEQITLRPIRPLAGLKKEQGVWVFEGSPSSASIPDLIDRVREQRGRDVL
jgi:AbrB family looped-hinge helix DNA binding protein